VGPPPSSPSFGSCWGNPTRAAHKAQSGPFSFRAAKVSPDLTQRHCWSPPALLLGVYEPSIRRDAAFLPPSPTLIAGGAWPAPRSIPLQTVSSFSRWTIGPGLISFPRRKLERPFKSAWSASTETNPDGATPPPGHFDFSEPRFRVHAARNEQSIAQTSRSGFPVAWRRRFRSGGLFTRES
jgi:hypothetical protein